eukprot:TRINITY_DN1214_c0_g1_i2.p1 TRINITY_DN1214_c0_g1~~TRINITY_DN1214_c0_g1_i2.p1  ORF type:complete len:152 (-),score=21.08 TRINITY_DN1214_c0_g1_i2:117-572(-)
MDAEISINSNKEDKAYVARLTSKEFKQSCLKWSKIIQEENYDFLLTPFAKDSFVKFRLKCVDIENIVECFQKPVSEYYDYTNIVKSPMCLDIVAANGKSSNYASNLDLFEDVLQILKNATLFHGRNKSYCHPYIIGYALYLVKSLFDILNK